MDNGVSAQAQSEAVLHAQDYMQVLRGRWKTIFLVFLNMLNSRWKYKNKQNLKIHSTITCSDNPPTAQTVKRLPAMQETRV